MAQQPQWVVAAWPAGVRRRAHHRARQGTGSAAGASSSQGSSASVCPCSAGIPDGQGALSTFARFRRPGRRGVVPQVLTSIQVLYAAQASAMSLCRARRSCTACVRPILGVVTADGIGWRPVSSPSNVPGWVWWHAAALQFVPECPLGRVSSTSAAGRPVGRPAGRPYPLTMGHELGWRVDVCRDARRRCRPRRVRRHRAPAHETGPATRPLGGDLLYASRAFTGGSLVPAA